MNKIYTAFMIFAVGGLLFASIPVPSNASANLDYMLTIAETAKKWCKSEIEARENIDPKILDLYLQSISAVDKLASAIDANDVKSAREHFILSMQKMREISLMINQLEILEAEPKPIINRNPVLDRFENNIQKLKSISIKLGANIDFYEIDNLMRSAQENHKSGNIQNVEEQIKEIAEQGAIIYQTLQSINEQNKIVRAKALAEKHIQKINIMILQAKELGLEESISKLEQTKMSLISANSTSQIKQHIKIVIVLDTRIQKSQSEAMEDAKRIELQLSQQQKFSLQISQLENKANVLKTNAYENNIAIYYLEKALSLIESVKLELDDPSKNVSEKIKQIDILLSKAEIILQQST